MWGTARMLALLWGIWGDTSAHKVPLGTTCTNSHPKPLLTKRPEQYVTLATVPGGSKARPPMKQGLGGPLSSRREAFTTRSLMKEGAERPSWSQKKVKGTPGALRKQRSALQRSVQSRSSQMQVSGATAN